MRMRIYHTVSLQRVVYMDHANLVLSSDIYIYRIQKDGTSEVCLSLFIPNVRIIERERDFDNLFVCAPGVRAYKKNKTENRIVPH